MLFVALFTLYLALAAYLALHLNSIAGDTMSRVTNAYYVLFSRDPHLAAVGFIWNPLPSLLALPFLPLMAIWPPLAREAFIADVWSALFTAAAAVELWRLTRDLRVPRWLGLVPVGLFALHPYVMQYAANGMTEAMFTFFVVATTRQLTRWIQSRATGDLVRAALWLGTAYLVRYEAAVMAAGMTLMVAAITYRRAQGEPRGRATAAIADGLILVTPFTAAFVLWGLASWLIKGSPFAQFSSAYGIEAQLGADALIFQGTGQGSFGAVGFMVGQILSLEPLVLPLVAAALLIAAWRRDWQIAAPLATFGAIIAFTIWAWLTGRTGGWLRYYIVLVPFAACLVAWSLAGIVRQIERTYERRDNWSGRVAMLLRRAALAASAIAVIAMATAALPTGMATVAAGARQPEGRLPDTYQYVVGKQIAAYVDALELPEGTVLVDAFLGFPTIIQSRDPRQFVITSDRDFEAILSDPSRFGVEYLLVPPPTEGLGELDALNRAYPNLYVDGGGIGQLVREFDSPIKRNHWRLYRVIGSTANSS